MSQQNVAQSASPSLQSSAADSRRNQPTGSLALPFQTQQQQSLGNHRLSSALSTEKPLASPQVMPLESAFAAATHPHQPTLAQSLQNRAPSWLRQGLQGMQQRFGTGREAAVSPLPRNQGPLIGIIDTGFAPGQHGHQMLQTIQGGNPDATILLAGGVGSGTWADSLTKFVDTAKATGQTRTVVNASFDLTQKNPDGSITTRQELTAQEKVALNYARENGVLVVASAGNEGGAMSALGKASQLSDNLIVVGSAKGNDRAAYSSYGKGLDFLFASSSDSSAGTSASAAKTTQTIAQIWAANPNLTPQQVVQTLEATAIDIQKPGWDTSSGLGIVNTEGAIHYAKTVAPAPEWMAQMGFTQPVNDVSPSAWNETGGAVATERSNWRSRGNVRRKGAAGGKIQTSPRREPRVSGVVRAVGPEAAAGKRFRTSSLPKQRRVSGVVRAVRPEAAAGKRFRTSSLPKQRRVSGVVRAVRPEAAAGKRFRTSSLPKQRRVSGVVRAVRPEAAAGKRFRTSSLPKQRRVSEVAKPISAGVAGAIMGSEIGLGRRLPLPERQLMGGFQAVNAIARTQRVINQSATRQSVSDLYRGSPLYPIISPIIGNPQNLFRDPEHNEAAEKLISSETPFGERVEAFNTINDKVGEHLGIVGKALDFQSDFGVGFIERGVESIQDIGNSFTGVVNAVRNPTQAINDLHSTAQAIREDPAGVGREIWNSFAQPYVDDWNNGQYGQAIARGAFDVVSSIGSGGVVAGLRVISRLGANLPGAPNSPGGAPSPGQGIPGSQPPGSPSDPGSAAPPPEGAPTPGGAAPEPGPAPEPSTGGNGPGSGSNSSQAGRAPSSGGAPGPETSDGPGGRGPAVSPPPGGAAPRSRPAPQLPPGPGGRGLAAPNPPGGALSSSDSELADPNVSRPPAADNPDRQPVTVGAYNLEQTSPSPDRSTADSRNYEPVAAGGGNGGTRPSDPPIAAATPPHSPWSPPSAEMPDLTPHIHTTGDRKYALDPEILLRLDEIRPGESLSQFARRIKTRIWEPGGIATAQDALNLLTRELSPQEKQHTENLGAAQSSQALGNQISRTDLEDALRTSGWIQAKPAKEWTQIDPGGGQPVRDMNGNIQGYLVSGRTTIWTSPNRNISVRIQQRPDGSHYARVFNGPSGSTVSHLKPNGGWSTNRGNGITQATPGEQALQFGGQTGSKALTHFDLLP